MSQPTSARSSTPRRLRDAKVPGWAIVVIVAVVVFVILVAGLLVRDAVVRSNDPAGIYAQISRLERTVDRNPDDVLARIDLGYAYQSAERFTEALDQYSAVLQIEPQNTAAHFNRGTIMQLTGKAERAEEEWWKVLEADPEHVLAASALGRYYADKQQYRSLLVAVKPTVEAHPEVAELQYLMGLAYENLGHEDWALARYKLAIERAPDLREAKAGIARLEAAE